MANRDKTNERAAKRQWAELPFASGSRVASPASPKWWACLQGKRGCDGHADVTKLPNRGVIPLITRKDCHTSCYKRRFVIATWRLYQLSVCTWLHCPAFHCGQEPRLHLLFDVGWVLELHLPSPPVHSTDRLLTPSPQDTEHCEIIKHENVM